MMSDNDTSRTNRRHRGLGFALLEFTLVFALMVVYAGDPPPMVNEAHYLIKAKNFWQPDWCAQDLFASSAKVHLVFSATFGWFTNVTTLASAAWIGRLIGWALLSLGLVRLSRALQLGPCMSLAVTVIWIAGIEYGNLAGEWVVGGIEAKVPAYAFVLLALAELVHRRWNRVWVLLGCASALHVLTGGWSVVAALFVWVVDHNGHLRLRKLVSVGLLAGGAVALLGLVPALLNTSAGEAAGEINPSRIYSFVRLQHHLLPASFRWHWYLRHAVLIGLTAALVAQVRTHDRKLFLRLGPVLAFGLGAVVIAAVGLLIGMLPSVAPDLSAKLLRFYWFRLSDAAVPLVLGLVCAALITSHHLRGPRRLATGVLLVATLLIATSSVHRARLGIPPSASNRLLGLSADQSVEQQRAAFRDWLKVCRWARTSTPEDEVFLTPRHQQTFKWYAGRSEVVNWKDVPQDPQSLIQWHTRFREIFPRRLGMVRVTINYERLREYRRRFGVRYVIVDRRIVGASLPLRQIYPLPAESNPTFAVYELPQLE